MRVLIQRVSEATVKINESIHNRIAQGMLVFVGVENDDKDEDIEYICKKIINLRIFDDDNGVMNKSVLQTGGEIMVISQFTLHANTRKGNRPSYIKAAKPDIAIPIYERFCKQLQVKLSTVIKTGQFGADMKISLINDGPVTIWIDSKKNSLMTIKEVQETVDKWIKTYGVRYFSELTNMAVLTEEVGELARIMARTYGDQSFKDKEISKNLGDEMADVLWVLICLANQTGVDLEEALKKNIEKKTLRDSERHFNNQKLNNNEI